MDGLGLVEMKAGNLDKAKALYDQAIKMGLSYSRKFNHLKTGQAFIDEGKYVEAELELQHALELQSTNPDIYIALGTVERALGQVNKGEKYYETALNYDPKNKKMQVLLEQAREERDRGSISYIFDRNGVPLALEWTKNGERGYPMGKECAHLIGYIDTATTNNRGTTGLEKVYQQYFPGNKLYLTLDSRIQKIISKAMGWQKGAIVVLNPRTGEILGCISQPTFTPEKVQTNGGIISPTTIRPSKTGPSKAFTSPAPSSRSSVRPPPWKRTSTSTPFSPFLQGIHLHRQPDFLRLAQTQDHQNPGGGLRHLLQHGLRETGLHSGGRHPLGVQQPVRL